MYKIFNNEKAINSSISWLILVGIIIQFVGLFYASNPPMNNITLVLLFLITIIVFSFNYHQLEPMNVRLLYLIVGLMLLSTLFGRGGIGAMINALILLLNVFVYSSIRISAKMMKIISKTYLIFLFLLRIVSIHKYTFYFNDNFFGFRLNPNTFGYLILIGSFFMFFLALSSNKVVIIIFTILVSSYFILESGSRTIMLAYLLFLTLNLFMRYKKERLPVKILILFHTLTFIFPFFYSKILPLFFHKDTLILGKGLFSGRQLIWNEIFSQMSTNWLIGVGASYGFINGKFFSAHNLWLGFASIFGVPVAILIIVLLGKIMREFSSGLNPSNQILLISMTSSLAVVSVFETALIFNLLVFFAPVIMLISGQDIDE